MNIEQQRGAFGDRPFHEITLRAKDLEELGLSVVFINSDRKDLIDLARKNALLIRDAIELDRQGRGGPVGEITGASYTSHGSDPRVSWNWPPQSGIMPCPLPVGTKLYIAPQPANPAIKESLTVAEPVKDAVRIYNSGYMAGHQDTVEGCFTDILSADMVTHHEDAVNELMGDLGAPQPAEPVQKAQNECSKDAESDEPVKVPSDEELSMLFGMWGWKTKEGRNIRFSHFKEMVEILLARYGSKS